MKIKIICFAIVLFAFIGCKETQNITTEEQNLESGEYKVLMLQEESVAGLNMLLNFNLDENRVSGFTGCNNFNGNIKVKGNKITLDKVVSTRKFCQDISPKETLFLKNLNQAHSFLLKGEKLQLKSTEGKILIEAKKAN